MCYNISHMADYIFIRKSRNALSSFLHIFLNILLGVGSILITVVTNTWIFGVILVFLSKWRIFAVRPRYWFLNIKSNIVDIVVGISFVLLAYFSGSTLIVSHYILAALYVIWLIFIKPMSSEAGTVTQSLFAIFFGSTSAIMATSSLDSIVLILVEFIIGYGASRHLFAQHTEGSFSLMSLVCGLLCAEVSWLCHSWMIIYTFGNTGIVIPQLALILTISAFSFIKIAYSIIKNDNKINYKEILAPAVFGIATISIIVISFSNPIFNI